jgi:AcrR family transcriptional regulator
MGGVFSPIKRRVSGPVWSSQRPRGRHPVPRMRERILGSAQELFARKGFDKVTADEIAAAARVGKGSVYRHFASKEGLYAAAITAGFVRLRFQIERALEEDRTFPERITAIVRQLMSFVWEHGDFFALLRDPGARLREAARTYQRERNELSLLITQVLKEGKAVGSIRGDLNFHLISEAILGTIRGIRRYHAREVTLDEAVSTMVALLLDGLTDRRAQLQQFEQGTRGLHG